MAPARLDRVRQLSVTVGVIDDTLAVLQRFGAHKLEGLVLWLGAVAPDVARVSQAFVPKQRPVTSEGGVGYFVEGEALFELNRTLSDTGLRLIAQVHSHPREAFHSETDDRYAIVTTEGGLSLVVPNFGNAPPSPASWAVYRLVQGAWEELGPDETRALIQIAEES